MRWRASFAALALTGAAQAEAPEPPAGAVEMVREARDRDSFAFPVRPFGGAEAMTARLEGALTLQALRLEGQATSLAVALDYRDRLTAQGFETVLFCAAHDCGGFDFRAALSVLPQPAMRVDLIDFHQLTMRRDGAGGAAWVSVLTSRTGGATHVQVAALTGAQAVAAGDAPAPEVPDADAGAAPAGGAQPVRDADPAPSALTAEPVPPNPEPPSPAPTDPGALLDRDGHVALDGVTFATGSTRIAEGAEDVLARAAAALAARAERDFVVVGHTDSAGALALNRRISAQRAEAVRAALIARGAPAARLSAEGAGWLTPRASNSTEAGRALNRRVEIVAR